MPGINEGKRRRKLAVNKSEFYCRKYHYPVDLLHRLPVRPVCFYRGTRGGGGVRLQPPSENVGSGPSDLTYNNYIRERE